MWLKYSDAPILNGEQWTREQDGELKALEFAKPRGFWITDDSDQCWRTWCVGERFNLDGLTHKHEVVLDETNIAILRSSYELRRFTDIYSVVKRWGPKDDPTKWASRCMNWPAVAKRYDGLIITPYQWSCRMDLKWYYGWDCASGCIWNASAIKEIRLLEIDYEVASVPAEEPSLEARYIDVD